MIMFTCGNLIHQSKGSRFEQIAAAEKAFGVTPRDGCWNDLGSIMIWITYDELDEMGVD